MSRVGVRRRLGSGARWRRERSFAGEEIEPLDSKVGVVKVVGRRERMQRVAVSGRLVSLAFIINCSIRDTVGMLLFGGVASNALPVVVVWIGVGLQGAHHMSIL